MICFCAALEFFHFLPLFNKMICMQLSCFSVGLWLLLLPLVIRSRVWPISPISLMKGVSLPRWFSNTTQGRFAWLHFDFTNSIWTRQLLSFPVVLPLIVRRHFRLMGVIVQGHCNNHNHHSPSHLWQIKREVTLRLWCLFVSKTSAYNIPWQNISPWTVIHA